MITISHRSTTVLRWILILPAALLGTWLAQMAGMVLSVQPMLWITDGSDSAWWLAKSVTSLLMGGTFVAAVVLVAPAYKRTVVLFGLGVVLVWAVLLVVGGPPVFGALMGGMGVLGAVFSYFVAFRGKGLPG